MHAPKSKRMAFIRRVVSQPPIDECVLWPFSCNVYGYGRMKIEGRSVTAHRVSLCLATGRNLNERLHALHTRECLGRSCINPKHLRWGTNEDNVADRVLFGNSTTRKRRLKSIEVLSIFSHPGTYQAIASEYGICVNTVWCIKSGKTWKELTKDIDKTQLSGQ